MFTKEGTHKIRTEGRTSTNSSRRSKTQLNLAPNSNCNSSRRNPKALQVTNILPNETKSEIEADSLDWEPESDAIRIVIPEELMSKVLSPPQALPSPDVLPKVSYRILPEPPPQTFKTFWIRPRSYVRFPEFSMEEVGNEDEKVEYEMDSEDEVWLHEYNESHHSTSGIVKLTEEEFEYIIDRLEKQAFLHSREMLLRAEEMVASACCAVCGDGTSDDTNQIVLCDGCDVAVHQNCYGVRLIPEGEWKCALCDNGLSSSQQCAFCGYSGGAQKPTTKPNEWVHVQCALWLEETGFSDPDCFGPVQYFKEIPPERQQLECYICHKIRGAPVQCAKENCTLAFHVTCAQRKHLAVVVEEDPDGRIVYRAWCVRHTPSFYRESLRMKNEEEKRRREEERQKKEELRCIEGGRRSKTRRQNWNFHHKDSDFVWDESFETFSKRQRRTNRYSEYLAEDNFEALKFCGGLKFSEARKHIRIVSSSVLSNVYKYWIEKRQKRRGFPLLKRFQPSVLTSLAPIPPPSIKEMNIYELRRGLNLLKTIRYQLEILRDSLTLVRRRERLKLKLLKIKNLIFENKFMPLLRDCRLLLKFFKEQDVLNIFKEPVSTEKVPDYYEIIKHPMDFRTIKNKINDQNYETEEQFVNDLTLVFNNAKTYNRPETIFYKEGERLLTLLTVLRKGESCEPYLADNSLELKAFFTVPKRKRGRPPKSLSYGTDVNAVLIGHSDESSEGSRIDGNKLLTDSTSASYDSSKELNEEIPKNNVNVFTSRLGTTAAITLPTEEDDEDFSGDESVARERQRVKQMNTQKQQQCFSQSSRIETTNLTPIKLNVNNNRNNSINNNKSNNNNNLNFSSREREPVFVRGQVL